MGFTPRHVLLALLLHGLMAVLLTAGVRCTKPPPAPPMMRAVFVDLRGTPAPVKQEPPPENREQIQQQAQEILKRAADEERTERERRQEEVLRVERERQAQIEQKRKQDKERKRLEDEKKKKQQQRDRSRLEEERKRREEEERHQRIQQEEDNFLAQQLRAEQDELLRSQQTRLEQTAMGEWIGRVQAHVQSRWRRPPDSLQNFKCTVTIEQLPGGQIRSRKITRSCGGALLDDSVLKAIDKSDPLPLISNPALHQRSFTFEFIPQ